MNDYLIAFEFTLKDHESILIDSNVGADPMFIQSGAGETLAAVENALLGMRCGEIHELRLSPGQAYGPVKDKAFRRIPIAEIPSEARAVGRKVATRNAQGEEVILDVVAVDLEYVTIDYNHPLAGRELFFTLRLIDKTPVLT